MDTHNAHIAVIPVILKSLGVEKIIISPGSRNAPLIQVFYKVFGENCISIVDERSAAYFALGVAIKSEKPVVIISTSGTATLNYAPAVAEAFHQGEPLIVITADRPLEWIDMQDNQTIRQQNIYAENCKAFHNLLVEYPEDKYQDVADIASEAYYRTISGKHGPVHINVPLREPLYNDISVDVENKILNFSNPPDYILDDWILHKWSSCRKIMIVFGQLKPIDDLDNIINKLLDDERVVVVAEPISNLKDKRIVSKLDVVRGINKDENDNYQPELVIYIGGQVVSRPFKEFLRNGNSEQCFVSLSGDKVNTFLNLKWVIKDNPTKFLKKLIDIPVPEMNSDFQVTWYRKNRYMQALMHAAVTEIPYCDLYVYKLLSELIGKNTILFAGNSSVIRYLQIYNLNPKEIYSNRGTSGIDGCLSTASGVASETEEAVVAILGDLSFVYDSNALWNRELPKNLKIIIINNQGGNIFGMIDGPSTQQTYNDYFVANHPVSIQKLSEAFGVKYIHAQSTVEINNEFKQFMGIEGCAIMEIKTPGNDNPGIFRNFIKNISK